MSDIRSAITEMGLALGMPGLHLDADDACAISLPDGLQLEMHYRERAAQLHLCADLGGLAQATQSELLVAAATSNVWLAYAAMPYLAYDRVNGRLILEKPISAQDLTAQTLQDALAAMALAARSVRERLGEGLLVM